MLHAEQEIEFLGLEIKIGHIILQRYITEKTKMRKLRIESN